MLLLFLFGPNNSIQAYSCILWTTKEVVTYE
uniref:Uncharacterized protein n=1 Tax=Arundo donax TaxID=35708 RepID=A0A0A8Y0S4_ARUDO